jgi:hypothetical protein
LKQRYQQRLEKLNGVENKNVLSNLQTATARLNELLARPHRTPEDYHISDMNVCHVVKSVCKALFESRFCLLDYALCKLDSRIPDREDSFYDPLPDRGFLMSLDWASDATHIGRLKMDKYVMKRGRSSGATYGIVAGVHSVMRHADTGTRREY